MIGPYVLHRTTKVPWWAAFLGPIVLGIVIPFWGVLLAPPLLAIIFAFRKPPRNSLVGRDSGAELVACLGQTKERTPDQAIDRDHHQRHDDGGEQQNLEIVRRRWRR